MMNKTDYSFLIKVLHGMFLDWLMLEGLLDVVLDEIEGRSIALNTLSKSMDDDDDYLYECTDDPYRTYCSHLDSVSMIKSLEWLKIDRAFRNNIKFAIDVNTVFNTNDGLLEFFDEAVTSSSYDVASVDGEHTAISKLQVLTDMAVAESNRNKLQRIEMRKSAAMLQDHAELEDIVAWINKYLSI